MGSNESASHDGTKHLCPRCAADPRPAHFGDDRQCAFHADGTFNPENWNCATIDALIGFPTRNDARVVHGNDEQCEVTPTYIDDDSDDYGGFIVTTRYKRRGRTESMVYVGQFNPALQVTFEFVERVIKSRESHEVWRKQYGMPDRREEFRERLADLMVEHGPDRHCDGYEIIADTLWSEFGSGTE